MELRQSIAHAQKQAVSKEQNASIIKCRLLGLGDATIAHIFDVSRQRVHKIAGPRIEAPPKPDPPRFDPQVEPNLSDLLRAWRDRHNWSQTRAAAELGVGLRTLSRWENERATCHLGRLIARFIDLYESAAKDS